MTLENAKSLAEEVDLMEAFGLFGFKTADGIISGRLEQGALGEYLCKSAADRFDRTVLPISTINLRILWLMTSGSEVASLILFCGVRLASPS